MHVTTCINLSLKTTYKIAQIISFTKFLMQQWPSEFYVFLSRGTNKCCLQTVLFCYFHHIYSSLVSNTDPCGKFSLCSILYIPTGIYSHIEGISYTLRYTNYLYVTYMFKIVLCYMDTGQMSKTVTTKFYTRIANVMAIYKYHPDNAEYDHVSREIVTKYPF